MSKTKKYRDVTITPQFKKTSFNEKNYRVLKVNVKTPIKPGKKEKFFKRVKKQMLKNYAGERTIVQLEGDHATSELVKELDSSLNLIGTKPLGIKYRLAVSAVGALSAIMGGQKVQQHLPKIKKNAGDYHSMQYLEKIGMESAATPEMEAGAESFLEAIPQTLWGAALLAGGITAAAAATYGIVKSIRNTDRKLYKACKKSDLNPTDDIHVMSERKFERVTQYQDSVSKLTELL